MKIVWLSDFASTGSGYAKISTYICNGLAEKGHEVVALGMNYQGEEHHNKFSLIPIMNIREIITATANLKNQWDFDVFICALDIPHHEKFLQYPLFANRTFPYIGIMPVEADPLVFDWTMALMQLDKVFVISQFGTDEVQSKGIENAEHLQIGVDTDVWKVPTEEDRKQAKEMLGIEEDEFVVLTVADNQERKFLHAAFEIFAEFQKDKKARYILVTREHALIGGKLRSYAQELGFADKLMLIERGVPEKNLWHIYSASDAFLLTSQAEGLGMILLEAMATKTPCVATNCTGIKELLSDGRGKLVDYWFTCRNPFGNCMRYYINTEHGIELLNEVYESCFDTNVGRRYIESRTWQVPVDQIDDTISEFEKMKRIKEGMEESLGPVYSGLIKNVKHEDSSDL